VAGSIRLYKQASHMSDENDVIFPTPEAQTRGVDAATENMTILAAHSNSSIHRRSVSYCISLCINQ
jgi:hypothetical protein